MEGERGGGEREEGKGEKEHGKKNDRGDDF